MQSTRTLCAATIYILGTASASFSQEMIPVVFPFSYTNSSFHADIMEMTDDEKTAWSDAVIEAEVIEAMSFERNGRVMSHLILQTAGGETRTVELDGGMLENRGSHRTDELYINTGATGTFYLNERGEVWVPAFGAASFVSSERNQTQWMGLARANLTLSTDWSAGNADQFVTITGSGFGNTQGDGYVTFDSGNDYYDANAAIQFNYTEWSDNSITLEVPNAYSNRVRVMTQSGELLESTDSLRIQYNIGSEPGSYYGDTHLNNQLDGGHLFYVNQEIFDFPERLDALERTLDDFVCKTGVNFRLAAESTSLGNDLGDGQNTITFDSSDAPLGMGTAGICWTNWWSCILGDITFYVVGEMDVVLNSAIDWDYSTGPVGEGQAKFAYVLIHELGHAMRLGHVNEWGESMYPTVTNWPSNEWCERDTISANERLGVSLAVERASTFTFDACGISSMVPLEVDCEPVVDIYENHGVSDAHLPLPFPNPFTDQLWIPSLEGGISTTKPTSVRILNSFGQVVERLTIPAAGALWNAEDQPDGIYFIQRMNAQSLLTPAAFSRVVKTTN